MINPKSHVYNQYGASEEKIMDAAETCPTHAINVDEKKSRRRIYPRESTARYFSAELI